MKFIKEYPDYSKMPFYINHLQLFNNYHAKDKMVRGFHSPQFLFYVAYWLAQLPPGAFVVYSGPAAGNALYPLARFFEPLRVLLIEDYSMLKDSDRSKLEQALADTRPICGLELIENDFCEIWPTLANVDFLLLDGPPTTTNFEPFSDHFIYMMHDIWQRLRGDDGGDSLEEYVNHLCNPHDIVNIAKLNNAHIPGRYKVEQQEFDKSLPPEYGPHAWFIGRK